MHIENKRSVASAWPWLLYEHLYQLLFGAGAKGVVLSWDKVWINVRKNPLA